MFSLCVLLVALFFRRFLGKLRLEIAVIICSLLNMKISFWSTICVAYHRTAPHRTTYHPPSTGKRRNKFINLCKISRLQSFRHCNLIFMAVCSGLAVRCSLFAVHCLYQPCIYEIHPSVNSRILCQLQQSLWVFIKFYDPEIVALISRQFMLHLSVLAKRNELERTQICGQVHKNQRHKDTESHLANEN